jgi:hypothetical protein
MPSSEGGVMNSVQQSAAVRELVPLLFVDDIELCVAFYMDKLGFTIQGRWEPDGRPGVCCGGTDRQSCFSKLATKTDRRVSVVAELSFTLPLTMRT